VPSPAAIADLANLPRQSCQDNGPISSQLIPFKINGRVARIHVRLIHMRLLSPPFVSEQKVGSSNRPGRNIFQYKPSP
jgi:hypothetical protein